MKTTWGELKKQMVDDLKPTILNEISDEIDALWRWCSLVTAAAFIIGVIVGFFAGRVL